MDEVETNSESLEITTPQTENHVEQPLEQNAKNSEIASDEKQQRNWRRLEKKASELERELRLQREMNDKLLQLATAQTHQQKQEVDEFEGMADNEVLNKRDIEKLVQSRAARIAEEAVKRETEKLYQNQQQTMLLQRLRSQYPDFNEVVNSENLSVLEEQEPELAQTIAESKDPYKVAMQSYKYIKALNIAQKAPEARRAREVEKKLEQNAKTVASPKDFDKRPMAQAFRMTDVEKKKLYSEMTQYASQVGFSY